MTPFHIRNQSRAHSWRKSQLLLFACSLVSTDSQTMFFKKKKKMLKPIYLRVLVFSTNYIAHHILSFTPIILVITSLQRKIYTGSILLKQHFT